MLGVRYHGWARRFKWAERTGSSGYDDVAISASTPLGRPPDQDFCCDLRVKATNRILRTFLTSLSVFSDFPVSNPFCQIASAAFPLNWVCGLIHEQLAIAGRH